MDYQEFQEQIIVDLKNGVCPWKRLTSSGCTKIGGRSLYLNKCEKCKEKIKRVTIEDEELKLSKRSIKTGIIFEKREGNVILDRTSYRIFSSIVFSYICPQVVEILDAWKCDNTLNYLEEKVSICDDYYSEEIEKQLPHILKDLSFFSFFTKRSITPEDLRVRHISHFYLDTRNKKRSSDITICLVVPDDSSFIFEGVTYST